MGSSPARGTFLSSSPASAFHGPGLRRPWRSAQDEDRHVVELWPPSAEACDVGQDGVADRGRNLSLDSAPISLEALAAIRIGKGNEFDIDWLTYWEPCFDC